MYILEGNIGAGKSTLLKLIAQRVPQLRVRYEPLDQWQKHVEGQSLLANFYQDPHRWAYSMETFTLLWRVQEHMGEQNNTEQNRIMERSIYSGHLCFARNSYQAGFMSDLEWDMYTRWFTFLTAHTCRPPQGFIYLQVSPEKALERVNARARAAEGSIPLHYLEQLHECHERFLIHKQGLPELSDVPVLVLNADQEFEHDPAYLSSLANAVQDFIQTYAQPSGVVHDEHARAL